MGSDQSTIEKYPEVSHLSGILVSILFISYPETVQPNYLHVNMCPYVQKSIYEMQTSMKAVFCPIPSSVSQRWHCFR